MRKKTKNISELLRKKCVTKAKWIARARANFTCAYCGKKEPNVKTHGSHIYSEGIYRAMSADIDNILCLCAVHHMAHSYWNRSDKFSWHGSPKEAIDWFNEKYPELSKELKDRTKKSIQADEFYWKKKLEELMQQENLLKLNCG